MYCEVSRSWNQGAGIHVRLLGVMGLCGFSEALRHGGHGSIYVGKGM